jgi:hypothetical protein
MAKRSEFKTWLELNDFSSLNVIQWVSGALSPVVKWLGCLADSTPSANAKVKNVWIYTVAPAYVFVA